MKYAVFFFGLFFIVPIMALLASYSRRVREIVFALMVFSTVFMDSYDINFLENMWYRASARSIQVSITDLLAYVLLLSIIFNLGRERFRLFWPASLGVMLAFLGYSSFSVAISDPKLFGLFLLLTILRGLLIFLAVVWYVRSKREVYILVYALGAVLIYEGTLALWQRYILHDFRVMGTFPHSNVLADFCCMISPVLLAVILLQTRFLVRCFFALAWILGGVAVVLSVSRMGAVLFAVGTAGVLLAAIIPEISWQKIALVLLLAAVAGGLLFRGYDKVQARHKEMSAAEEDGNASTGRKVYYRIAWVIVSEHPFGIGLNNWASWYNSNLGKIAVEVEAGETAADLPHVLHAQVLGELGWPGLLIFMALWYQWFMIAGRIIFVRRPNLISQVGMGCFVSIVTVAIGGTTESLFFIQYIYLMFNILLGYAVAATQIRMIS